MVNFDDTMKAAIVQTHNEKRNFIAGGGAASLQPACRMATMQWDDELASVAALNVRQCKMAHDKCRNTDNFKYSGQNLAWRRYSGTPNYGNMLQKSMDMWYDEVSNTKMDYINNFPSAYKGPYVFTEKLLCLEVKVNLLGFPISSRAIAHFTVMMADRNIRVGCAASTYTDIENPQKQIFLVACNYATTNMLGFPIYTSCSSAGSSCTTGSNSQYPNLCSASEVYDVNKW